MTRLVIGLVACTVALLGGCKAPGISAKGESSAPPAVPAEVQSLGEMALGPTAEVFSFGDLAGNGHQQAVIMNRLPEASHTAISFSRAAILQKDEAKWVEVLRCDEYLKNPKGFLESNRVTGWQLQIPTSAHGAPAMLYFKPLKTDGAKPASTIPVGWNPKVGRYQVIAGGRFIDEIATLETPVLRLR
jgi:hypothetical protein